MDISEKFLSELNLKIRHLTSPQLRADALFSLLNIELKKCKDINLLASSKDTILMVESMNKMDTVLSLEYGVHLINHFIETNNFNLGVIVDYQNDSKKFTMLKAKIKELIEIESEEPVFF